MNKYDSTVNKLTNLTAQKFFKTYHSTTKKSYDIDLILQNLINFLKYETDGRLIV